MSTPHASSSLATYVPVLKPLRKPVSRDHGVFGQPMFYAEK